MHFNFNLEENLGPDDDVDISSSFWINARAYLDPVSAMNVVASRALTSDYFVPVPKGINPLTGKPFAYLPFQLAGVEYAMKRKDTLNSDSMGVGKTIQGIGVANADKLAHRILVVCPSFLKDNWLREWIKWDVKKLNVSVIRKGKKDKPFPLGDVIIINYELLESWRTELRQQVWDLMIVDECHYLKSKKASRTLEIYGCRKWKEQEAISPIVARRRLFLSGTPLLNKPREMWPLIHSFDPNGLGANQMIFDKRYCNGHWELIIPKSRLTFHGVPCAPPTDTSKFKKVWNNSGASNLEELQQYLRSKFMIRRLRSEVLPQLDATQRQVVLLDIGSIANLLKQERKIYEEFGDSIADLAIDTPAFAEISKTRALLGIKKVPFIVDRVNEALEDTKKIVVFVHHHEVIDLLAAEFVGRSVVVDGRVDPDDRQALVDRFQTDPAVEILLATMASCGVGYTLVAAWLVIFGELDWKPAIMRQCEDRLNRIGQTQNVHAMYLIVAGSLDERQFQLLVEKQEIADATLDTI